ncbi:MAG: hypothetical protein HY901_01175 [Deltaproteobacteria bacterium]|nr:hypothetical protein [Deltaproteobacteria bacterium]
MALLAAAAISGGAIFACSEGKIDPPGSQLDGGAEVSPDASEGSGADAQTPGPGPVAELPLDPAYSFVAYPMISQGKLYALGISPKLTSLQPAPRELALFIYDLAGDQPSFVAKKVVEPDMAVGEVQPKLLQTDVGEILIVSTPLTDSARTVSFYSPEKDSLARVVLGRQCPGIDPANKTANDQLRGHPVSVDGEVLFSDGVGFSQPSICGPGQSGLTVCRPNENFKLTSRKPIVRGNTIYFFEATYGVQEFFAMDYAELYDFEHSIAEKEKLFAIDFPSFAETVSLPVHAKGHLFFVIRDLTDRTMKLVWFEDQHGAQRGSFALAPVGQSLSGSYELMQPVISGDKLIVDELSAGTGGSIQTLILKIASAEPGAALQASVAARIAHDQMHPFWMLPIVSGQHAYVARQKCVQGCEAAGDGPEVLSHWFDVVSLESGEVTQKIESGLFASNWFALPLVDEDLGGDKSGWLMHQGKLVFLQNRAEAGGIRGYLVTVSTNDTSAQRLQANFTSTGNASVTLTAPPPAATAPAEEAPPAGQDFPEEVDPGQDAPRGPDLLHGGLFDQWSSFPASWSAWLQTVEFSSNGEESNGDLGEGAFQADSTWACKAHRLYYPSRMYFPLKEGSKSHLKASPGLPLLQLPFSTLEEVTAKVTKDPRERITLAYKAYEHDTRDWGETILNTTSNILQFASGLYSGDVCLMASSASEQLTVITEDLHEGFGAPFLGIKPAPDQSGIFGIAAGTTSRQLSLSAADQMSTTDMLVQNFDSAIAQACSAVRVVQSSGAALPAEIDTLTSFDYTTGATGRWTRGEIQLKKSTLVPITRLKVTLKSVNVSASASGLDLQREVLLHTRVGVLGEDRSTTQGLSGIQKTPFSAYRKKSQPILLSEVNAQSLTLLDADFTAAKGTTGFYVEVGMEAMFESGLGVALPRPTLLYSEGRLLEDAFWGAWEQDGTRRAFKKTVRKPVSMPLASGTLELEYSIELAPKTFSF